MPKLENPKAEKERDYQHQRVITAEYPHRYVAGRRKKKKGTSRNHRREVRQLLEQHTPLYDSLEAKLPETVRRAKSVWSGTDSLGTALNYKRRRRVNTVAFNMFKQTYSSELHRQPFAAFLHSLTTAKPTTKSSENPFMLEVAKRFWTYLDPTLERELHQQKWLERFYVWLEEFFNDEPAWKPRLIEWLERMTTEADLQKGKA